MNKLRETPKCDRPCEKALRCGIGALTDAELLAVILRTGSAGTDVLTLSQRLLELDGTEDGLSGLLHHSYEEYAACEGIGSVKAVQLLSIGELARRIWRREAGRAASAFSEPAVCARYYMQEMRHLEQEELRVAYLDTRLRLMKDQLLTRGTVDSSVLSVREIMISALRHRAVHLILIHNHPSGDPSPSREDMAVTKQVAEAGKLVGIRLADHIIIGDNTYYSFKEWGTL